MGTSQTDPTTERRIPPPLEPTRRQMLSMLAATPLLAGFGSVTSAERASPLASTRPLAVSHATRLYGRYYGESTVELLVKGDVRTIQRPVEVVVSHPADWNGVVEDNPFHLAVQTVEEDPSEITEGKFSLLSASLQGRGKQSPGLDYRPTPQRLVQHWDFALGDGSLSGTFTSLEGNIYYNVVWFDELVPGYGTFVQPAPFGAGTRLAGRITDSRFGATIEGGSSRIDDFRVTIAAERARL